MHIGTQELLLIVLLILVLFGANRFPRIMENFANGIKSFKKTMKEKDDSQSKKVVKNKKTTSSKSESKGKSKKSKKK